jgi:hypothetical protein
VTRLSTKRKKAPAGSSTGRKNLLPPYHPVEAFRPVADLIIANPPIWLAEFLQSWSPTIYLGRAVELRQPTRAQMGKILSRVKESAALIRRATNEPSIREFLDAAGKAPLDAAFKFDRVLGELQSRAAQASKSPSLVNNENRTKAGRGRAMPDGTITAQVYCALLVAEIWKKFQKKYPAPRNKEATKATDLYWELSLGKRESWGDDPSTAWRYHLTEAANTPAEKDRAEIQRHLRESAWQAELLKPDAAPEPGK